MRRFVILMLLCLMTTALLAQTYFLYEDWESGTEEWTIANYTAGAAPSIWHRGIAVACNSEYSMYISYDNGVTNAYNYTVIGTHFFYRDVQFPAGLTEITLSFDIRCLGQENLDYVRVYMLPANITPEATSTHNPANSPNAPYFEHIIGESQYNVATLTNPDDWNRVDIAIPTSWAGQTARLAFSWTNDSDFFQNTQPPGAIDNIVITSPSDAGTPLPARLVTPSNASTFIPTDVTLTWTANFLGSQPTGYHVYLDTVNPPVAQVATNQTGLTYQATNLGFSTPYYWQVIPLNEHGIAPNCPVWSFTTVPQGFVGLGSGNAQSIAPVSVSSSLSVSQMIFTQAELAAAGMGAGQITRLSFQAGTAGINMNTQVNNNWLIYIGETQQSAFADNSVGSWIPITAMTQVHRGYVARSSLGATEWMDIDFVLPFNLSGTGNLVIFINEYITSSSGTEANRWMGTDVGANRTVYSYKNTAGVYLPEGTVAWNTGTSSVSTIRPNIRLIVTPPLQDDLFLSNLSGPSVSPSSTPFSVSVANRGTADVAAGAYSIQFYREDPADPVALGSPFTTTPAIPSNTVATITVSDISDWGFDSVSVITNYNIYAILTYQPDTNTQNNTSNTIPVTVAPAGMAVIDLMPEAGEATAYAQPVNFTLRHSISQTIYTVAELGGMASYGQVKNLLFRFNRTNAASGQDVQVYLANAPASFSAFANTSAWLPYENFVKVWDAPLPLQGTGLQEINLDIGAGYGPQTQDFLYEGENIVLLMYKTNADYYSESNVWHLNSGTSGVNRALYYSANANPNPIEIETPPTGSRAVTYAKIKFYIELQEPPENDLAIQSLSGPMPSIYSPTAEYVLSVRNAGAYDVPAGEYSIQFYRETASGGQPIGTAITATPPILAGETVPITISNTSDWGLDAVETTTTLHIYAVLIWSVDVNPANNISHSLEITAFPADVALIDLMLEGGYTQTQYPVNYVMNSSLSQTIYTQAELGGMGSYGVVSSLIFRFVNSDVPPNVPVRVWLANAPATLSSFESSNAIYPVSNFVKVWDGPLPHTASGLQDFMMNIGAGHGAGTADFVYDGENIVMMMYRNDTDGYGNNAWHVNEAGVGINRTLWLYSASTGAIDPASPTPAGVSNGVTRRYAKVKIYIDRYPLGTLMGTVTDSESNALIEGARVFVSTNPTMFTTTDASGAYSMLNTPMERDITYFAIGYVPQTLSPSQLNWNSQTGIGQKDLALVPRTDGGRKIYGVVRTADTIAGVNNLQVTLTGYINGTTLTSTVDGVSGYYEFTGLYANETYTVAVSKENFSSYSATHLVQAGVDLQVNITLTEFVSAPYRLVAEYVPAEPNHTLITWWNPLWGYSSFSYARPGYDGAIGHTEDLDLITVHRYNQDRLLQFGAAGMELYRVSFIPFTDYHEYSIVIWTTDNNTLTTPATLTPILTVPVATVVYKEMNTVTLPEVVSIPTIGQLFVGVHMTGEFGYPGAYDESNYVAGFSDIYRFTNGSWYFGGTTTPIPFPVSWCIYLEAIAPADPSHPAPVIYSALNGNSTEEIGQGGELFASYSEDRPTFTDYFLGIKENSVTRAFNSQFDIYRMLNNDTAGSHNFLTMHTVPSLTVRDLSFTDTSWGSTGTNIYKYAVRTRLEGDGYIGGVLRSSATYSNDLSHQAIGSLTTNIHRTSGATAGAVIALTSPDPNVNNQSYTLTGADGGSHTFSIYRNTPYHLTVTLEGTTGHAQDYIFYELETQLHINMVAHGTSVFAESFNESMIPVGWVNVDADNDGYPWRFGANTIQGPGDSGFAVYSQASASGESLLPDNWLISLPIDVPTAGASSLRFLVAAQDQAYPHDRLLVYAAPAVAGQVSWANFLVNRNPVGGVGGSPNSEVLQPEATMLVDHAVHTSGGDGFYALEYDISAYAGQSVRIAFRHAFCQGGYIVKLANMDIMYSPYANPVNVTGTVLSGTTPVADARVALSNSTTYFVRTNAQGAFTLESIAGQSTYTVLVSKDGYQANNSTIITVGTTNYNITTPIDLTPRTDVDMYIKGRVFFMDTGLGQDGVTVELTGPVTASVVTSTTAEGAGSFIFTGLAGNTNYNLSVNYTDYAPFTQIVPLDVTSIDNFEIYLSELIAPPSIVTATVNPADYSEALLSWINPRWGQSSFSYARPRADDVLGNASYPIEMTIAHRYDHAKLVGFGAAGYELYKVGFIPPNENYTYTVQVWTTNNNSIVYPETLVPVVSVLATNIEVGEMNELTLPYTVLIPPTGQLFIGVQISGPAGHPATFDRSNYVAGFSDALRWNGIWTSVGANFPISWCLYAHALEADAVNPAPLILSLENEVEENGLAHSEIRGKTPAYTTLSLPNSIELSNVQLGYFPPSRDGVRDYNGEFEIYRMPPNAQVEPRYMIGTPTIPTTTRIMNWYDTAWGSLTPGASYKYAVRTKYTGAGYQDGYTTSAPAYSNILVNAYDISIESLTGPPMIPAIEPFIVNIHNIGGYPAPAGEYSIQLYYIPPQGTATPLGELITATPAVSGGGKAQLVITDFSTWNWTVSEMEVMEVYAVISWPAEDIYTNNNTSNSLSICAFPQGVGSANLMPAIGGVTNTLLPINYYYRSSLSQTIFTAQEIGGMSNFGELSHLFLKFTDVGDVPPSAIVQVYLANIPTEVTTFSSSNDWANYSNFTQVYNSRFPIGSDSVPRQGTKIFNIKLGTGEGCEPFTYEGGNLIVMMFKTDTNWRSSNNQFHLNSGTNGVNRSLYISSDSASPPYSPDNPSVAGNLSILYPKIVFVFNKLPLGTLTGRIADENNQPMPNAQVYVTNVPVINTNTNGQGNYTLTGVPITYDVSATSFGYEIETIAAQDIGWNDAQPYASTLNVNLTPRPFVSIAGQVKLSDTGAGEDGVTITLYGYANGQTVSFTQGDTPGYFIFENLYGNTDYTLTIRKARYAQYSMQVTVADDDVVLPAFTLMEIISPPYLVTAKIEDNDISSTLIRWWNPLWGYTSFSYARPVMSGSIGNGDNNLDMILVHRYTPQKLVEFNAVGYDLYEVDFIPYSSNHTYTVMVWVTTNNTLIYPVSLTPVASVTVDTAVEGAINEVVLPDMIRIPANAQIFIGLGITGPPGYPAAYDAGSYVAGLSDILCWFGTWQLANSQNMEIAWTIFAKAIQAEPNDASPLVFSEVASPNANTGKIATGCEIVSYPHGYDVTFDDYHLGYIPNRLTRGFNGYFEIYRMLATDGLPNSPIDMTSALDITQRDMQYIDSEWGDIPDNLYKYAVRTIYTGAAYPGGNSLSVPSFSNNILKALTGILTVRVSMQGSSVAGAAITIINDDAYIPDYSYILTAADNGSQSFNIYRGIPYIITVSLPGASYYYREHIFHQLHNTLQVSLLSIDEHFSESFASGVQPTGWTVNDADNDGFGWRFTGFSGPTPGTASAYSNSFDNTAGPLRPDNWLISPPIEIPEDTAAKLEFLIAATDQTWPEDRVLIYVAPEGEGTPSWQTFLVNRSPVSGPTGDPYSEEWRDGVSLLDDHIVRAEPNNNGFYKLEYDISGYTGQSVHIGFRHAFCENMYVVKIANMMVGVSWYYPITVRGVVHNLNGSPLRGVLVSISSPMEISTITNNSGSFALYGVPGENNYTVSFRYEELEVVNVDITTSVDDYTFAEPIVMGGVSEVDDTLKPITTALHTNYPNPFNPSTIISFDMHREGRVNIDIYNIKGQKVKALVNDVYHAGVHKVVWDGLSDNGKPVSSGVYFYRMQTEGFVGVKKMLLMK